MTASEENTFCRPALSAVPGGEPSEPSSDAGGVKMGCANIPGRSDEMSAFIGAKSEQATAPSKRTEEREQTA